MISIKAESNAASYNMFMLPSPFACSSTEDVQEANNSGKKSAAAIIDLKSEDFIPAVSECGIFIDMFFFITNPSYEKQTECLNETLK